jgi:hypothetical protein
MTYVVVDKKTSELVKDEKGNDLYLGFPKQAERLANELNYQAEEEDRYEAKPV